MKLAIADPPYLGRSARWYGDGRGSGRVLNAPGRPGKKPDHHPAASDWDAPQRHIALIHELTESYDGWVVAGASDYIKLLLNAAPDDAQLAIWNKPNAMPGGGRIHRTYEPVIVRVPPGRRGRATGMRVRDVLTSPVLPRGFLGAKPPAWTRWCLDMLCYDPATDEVDDIFSGSGAVASAIDGLLVQATDPEGKTSER